MASCQLYLWEKVLTDNFYCGPQLSLHHLTLKQDRMLMLITKFAYFIHEHLGKALKVRCKNVTKPMVEPKKRQIHFQQKKEEQL